MENDKITQRIYNCLWFDNQAEEAAHHYLSIFPNSKILHIARYGKEGHEIHNQPVGSVMTVEFVLDGQQFLGLNGGPIFKFNEAISLTVNCEDQEEVDYYWSRLTEGGEEGPCGWLKDKFGLSWQIVPRQLSEMMRSPDTAAVARVTNAYLRMNKYDIARLEAAFAG